jgi:undecaprenyl-diphosphatase
MTDLLIAVVLGIVEGVTEFVPVSSTGHLIVAGHLLGFTGDRADTFEIFIQLGAILAVVTIYWQRMLSMATLQSGDGVQGRRGLALVAVTTLPALVLGAVLHDTIKDRLFSPTTVAIGWGVGGLVLIGLTRMLPRVRVNRLDELTLADALVIGVAQCVALWPGASRSAATMSGAMLCGVDRAAAAEYSFLAAVPVIGAATVFDLYSSRDVLTGSDLPMFAVGFAVSFLVAWVAVRAFLAVLASVTLRPFGWYRIAAAIGLLIAVSAGWAGL